MFCNVESNMLRHSFTDFWAFVCGRAVATCDNLKVFTVEPDTYTGISLPWASTTWYGGLPDSSSHLWFKLSAKMVISFVNKQNQMASASNFYLCRHQPPPPFMFAMWGVWLVAWSLASSSLKSLSRRKTTTIPTSPHEVAHPHRRPEIPT